MKKLASILLAVIFVVSLIGCAKEKEPEIVACTFGVTSYDYDEYLSIYGHGSSLLQGAEPTEQTILLPDLILPILKNDKFYGHLVSVSSKVHTHLFSARQLEEGEQTLRSIKVSVSIDEGDFYDVLAENNSYVKYISDEYAYNSYANIWYVKYLGKTITLDFPNATTISEPEMINDYFDFEVLNPSSEQTLTN